MLAIAHLLAALLQVRRLVDLFTDFQADVRFLLADLVGLLNGCVAQRGQDLSQVRFTLIAKLPVALKAQLTCCHAHPTDSQVGVACWVTILEKCGPGFTESQWDVALGALCESFDQTLPKQLADAELRTAVGLEPRGKQVDAGDNHEAEAQGAGQAAGISVAGKVDVPSDVDEQDDAKAQASSESAVATPRGSKSRGYS